MSCGVLDEVRKIAADIFYWCIYFFFLRFLVWLTDHVGELNAEPTEVSWKTQRKKNPYCNEGNHLSI